MNLRKIDKALEKLAELHYIEKYDSGYRFTDDGRSYTREKTGFGCRYMSRFCNTELWLYDNNHLPRGRFARVNIMTEDEFSSFCKFYNINVEDDRQLEVYDEVEFMDI